MDKEALKREKSLPESIPVGVFPLDRDGMPCGLGPACRYVLVCSPLPLSIETARLTFEKRGFVVSDVTPSFDSKTMVHSVRVCLKPDEKQRRLV